jgi:hypothetical protein
LRVFYQNTFHRHTIKFLKSIIPTGLRAWGRNPRAGNVTEIPDPPLLRSPALSRAPLNGGYLHKRVRGRNTDSTFSPPETWWQSGSRNPSWRGRITRPRARNAASSFARRHPTDATAHRARRQATHRLAPPSLPPPGHSPPPTSQTAPHSAASAFGHQGRACASPLRPYAASLGNLEDRSLHCSSAPGLGWLLRVGQLDPQPSPPPACLVDCRTSENKTQTQVFGGKEDLLP